MMLSVQAKPGGLGHATPDSICLYPSLQTANVLGKELHSLTESCPTFCSHTACCPAGSSVHGLFQARILEQVAISYSRGSSRPRDWTRVSCFSCTGRWIIYHCATWGKSPCKELPSKTRPQGLRCKVHEQVYFPSIRETDGLEDSEGPRNRASDHSAPSALQLFLRPSQAARGRSGQPQLLLPAPKAAAATNRPTSLGPLTGKIAFQPIVLLDTD